MRRSVQQSLPPMELTTVDLPASSRSTTIDQATEQLRRAVADRGYTLDALEAATGKDRGYIHKVLQGDKPASLAFVTSLPRDVQQRFEQLRAESLDLICVEPAAGPDAMRQLVSGLVGLLGRKAVA